MNFSIFTSIPLLLIFLIVGLCNGNSVLKNVRQFAEEAAKGLKLDKLSHYFVDFAHLNGFVMINKEQYEAIAEDEAAAIEETVVGASSQDVVPVPSGHGIEEKRHHHRGKRDTKTKHLKLVDPNQLSNHHSITVSSMLFPSPYPSELFAMAVKVQPLMAELHFRASFDVKFLLDATRETVKSDTLVNEMVKIMKRVEREGRRNPITLIMQRSDYLTDEEVDSKSGRKTISLKQIEATNSIGKGQGFGHMTSLIHQRVLDKVKHSRWGANLPEWLTKANVEKNEILEKQARALYKAWKMFTQKYPASEDAIILLISVPKRKHYCHFEQLIWGQFKLEDIAWEQGDHPLVEQITFEQMTQGLSVSQDGHGHHHLYYESEEAGATKRKVAIAYFHDGFIPEHFTRPEEWKIREQMEMSTAIMSPSVYMHLMGSKTVQEGLAKPGAVEKYFQGEEDKEELIKMLRSTFIQMWALGDGDDKGIVDTAIANPKGYVLKANTDGGKGNFFDNTMARMLEDLRENAEERSKYILQKRITPFRVKNAIIPQPPTAESSIHFDEVDTEISIYGSMLVLTEEENGKTRHKLEFNDYDGYFARTKLSSKPQCNISAGFGGGDSLVLFPKDNFEHERQ